MHAYPTSFASESPGLYPYATRSPSIDSLRNKVLPILAVQSTFSNGDNKRAVCTSQQSSHVLRCVSTCNQKPSVVIKHSLVEI